MKRFLLSACVANALLFTGGEALGHGGQYRGPGDVVPPSEGPGPGTGGPPTGGPPGTGGSDGPQTPGGGIGPTTPGGTGLGVPGGGPRGPTTPGGRGLGKKRAGGGEGFEQWQFWWEFNKDPYLDLKARLGPGGTITGSSGFLLGGGRRVDADAARRLSQAEVESRLVPLLTEMLQEADADIVDSAVLALGRSVQTEAAGLILQDVVNTLANSNPSAQQSAILSLGVLGSSEAVPWLTAILNDSAEGRRLLAKRGEIGAMERAFAAFALGLIGAPEAIPVLEEAVVRPGDPAIDVRAGAILALGLFHEGRDGIVRFLAARLEDPATDERIQAQVPISLGRLDAAAESVLPALLKLVKSKKTLRQVRRSAIVALGRIAQPADKEVFDALFETVADEGDDQSRHFALIAIAQLGARAVRGGETDGDLVPGLVRDLSRELVKGPRTHRPWTGLALALIGRELSEASPDRSRITQQLVQAFEDTNDPSHKAGHAIALGLLAARSAAGPLHDVLIESNDRNLQGYVAVALGMMRHVAALDTLRKMVLDDRDEKFRMQVATALGLMGDVQAVEVLVGAMRDARTLSEISSIAKALGLIGDRSAIEPLESLLRDRTAPGIARGFGCVALGLIAERSALPWNAPLSVDSNYRTPIAALYEVLDIL